MSLQIGISSYFNPSLPPVKVIQLLLAADFRILSVWGADLPGTGLMPRPYKDQLRLARKYFGVTYDSLHAPLLLTPDLYSSDASVRTKAIDRLKLAFDDAASLNIPIVIVHTHRTGDPDELSPAAQRSFTELIQSLPAAGPRLAVENTPGSIALLEWVLAEFPADNVGLCYDSCHDQLAAGRTFDLLRRHGRRLLTTHISDNLGQKDDHFPPGQGVIDWQAFVDAFPWTTYQGHFMLEPDMNTSTITDPAEYLAACRSGAERILALTRPDGS